MACNLLIDGLIPAIAITIIVNLIYKERWKKKKTKKDMILISVIIFLLTIFGVWRLYC